MTRQSGVGEAASTTSASERRMLGKSELTGGKLGAGLLHHLESSRPLAQPPELQIRCPECGSEKLWRDGLRYVLSDEEPIQRFLCRTCGYRFSQPSEQLNVTSKTLHSSSNLAKSPIRDWNFSFEKSLDDSALSLGEDVASHTATVTGKQLNSLRSYGSNCQVCESEAEGSKNLSAVEAQNQSAVIITHGNIEEDLANYAIWLRSKGLDNYTISERVKALKRLKVRNANLYEPSSVWTAISQYIRKNKQPLSIGSKKLLKQAYVSFAAYLNIPLPPRDMPTYKERKRRKPAPLETDLDLIIARAGHKLRPFLVTLKQLACRKGEAGKLRWKDVNLEQKTIFIRETEKQGVQRTEPISTRLTEMLKCLPSLSKNDPEAYVFGENASYRMGKLFWCCRRKLARDLGNPRLLQITLHDFRRWNGTRVALETGDPYAVMKALGQRSITSTESYVDVEQLEPLQTVCKAVTTLDEERVLIEQGFTFIKDRKVGETTYSLYQKKVARRPD